MAAWWTRKVDEIYALIPDFGGFLVKANSEGQPGPQDFKRSHAEGANLLADALRPHGGIVMWRAFVYSSDVPDDRHKQAYAEFKPLDGSFRDNVMVQVKNGAIDFQPREPFHPLFGAMPRTPLMLELQITKEYLGFATHLVYLAPLFEETLGADTHAKGPGSTVASVIDGSSDGHALTGMAGVSNIGTDRNWCGSVFDCANWYAFGRLAWDPSLGSRAIADEWLRATFTNDPGFVTAVTELMLASRQAPVDYMTPLGLHHLMARSHHYGPGRGSRAGRAPTGPRSTTTAPTPTASASTARRAAATPSDSTSPPWRRASARSTRWATTTCSGSTTCRGPTAWPRAGRSGRSCCSATRRASTRCARCRRRGSRSPARSTRSATSETRAFLKIQEQEARWWRDASVLYFQTFSKLPIPPGYEKPEHDLEYYKAINKKYVPGI